jgi:deazaflavin-dependent oxidoreductase (nitroreductase family)
VAETSFFMRTGNIFFSGILRSPLHGLFSSNFMLVSVTGRKSGKIYTTPVNYHRMGEALQVVSLRERTWWRNLRGEGASATLRLRGKDVQALGKAIEDERGVAEALAAYLKQAPQNAKYFEVTLDPAGQPRPEDLQQAAKGRVMVEFQLQ